MTPQELMRHYQDGVTERGGCGGPVLMTMFALLIVFLLAGCKTQYVPVIEHHSDTTYITKWQRDSIWLHDSVFVKERGDSVLVERWHTKYVERVKVDTLYQHITDSVPKPYPVPAELTTWQRVKVDYGGYAMLAVVGVIVYLIFRIKKNFSL